MQNSWSFSNNITVLHKAEFTASNSSIKVKTYLTCNLLWLMKFCKRTSSIIPASLWLDIVWVQWKSGTWLSLTSSSELAVHLCFFGGPSPSSLTLFFIFQKSDSKTANYDTICCITKQNGEKFIACHSPLYLHKQEFASSKAIAAKNMATFNHMSEAPTPALRN